MYSYVHINVFSTLNEAPCSIQIDYIGKAMGIIKPQNDLVRSIVRENSELITVRKECFHCCASSRNVYWRLKAATFAS